MSVWNVRILASVYSDGQLEFWPAEVYYDKPNGTPNGYADLSVHGETMDDIRFYAEEILKALEKPVLMAGDAFPIEYKP